MFRSVGRAYIIESLVLSYIETLSQFLATFLATICWSINCMSSMSLYYATYIRHVQYLEHYLCLRSFSVYGKSSSNYCVRFQIFSGL